MDIGSIAVAAGALLVWTLVSARLGRIDVTGPMALVVLGVFMTGISLAIALGLFGELRAGDFMIYIAWFGVAFFGLALFGAIRSMMTMNGVVVTLSPQGIRDIRISKEPIPWADIRDITTWSYRTQKLMVLKVDADTRKRLGFGAMARWGNRMSRMLGADGMCITAQGLKIRYRDLFDTSMAYWQAHSGRTEH